VGMGSVTLSEKLLGSGSVKKKLNPAFQFRYNCNFTEEVSWVIRLEKDVGSNMCN